MDKVAEKVLNKALIEAHVETQKQIKEMKEQKKEQFQVDKIEDTPFAIVTQNNETFVACGRCKGCYYKNYEEAKKAIENKEWETIILLISTIIDAYNKKD